MPTTALLELLAEVPGQVYVSPWKLLASVILFTLWVLFAQWVDKDTIAVNTYRTVWNVISMICGTVAAVLLLLLPEFLAAVPAFLVINIAFGTVYIVHRNGLVLEADKVGNAAHIKRVLTEGFRKDDKKEKREVSERVRITGANREVIKIPEEDLEREQYALAQDLLFDVLWRRANMVEMNPAGEATKIRVHVDGVAQERDPIPRGEGDGILHFFKQAAGLDLEERRKPQRGQILAAISDKHRYDVIVRTDGSTVGEKLSLRVIGPEKDFKIADLGFTEPQLETVRELMNSDRGIIVLSAPPRSGLTTTIYSVTRSHDAFLQNIQMVERESEMAINNITQHVFQPTEEKSFADEIQRVIRTDPDVIVLPDLREKAVAPVLSAAATKKQLVYVAVTALDILDALKKWAGMVGDAGLLARTLRAVTHQRLVRVLCPSCKEPYKPDAATLKKINMPADKVLYRVPKPQYDKKGELIVCQNCHGAGYTGRTGIYNMLVIDDELKRVIAGGGSLTDIRSAAMKSGSLSLQQHALQKVFDGVTSIEEVVRATRPPQPAGARAAKPAAKKPTTDKTSAA